MGDIANACGVGKATVSRALNGRSYVKPAVAEKIRAKAEELGYRPDPALSVLSQHRWNRPAAPGITLAVLRVQSPGAPSVADMYMEGIRDRAEALGYNVEEFVAHAGNPVKKIGHILYSRGIRGLLIPPVIEPVEWDLDWSQFSAVGCGIGEFRLPIHSVDFNHFSSTRQCWKQCLSRGYKRIGPALFRQPGPDNNDSLKHGAIYYEQNERSSTSAKIPIFQGRLNDREPFYAWFEKHRPDAVIGMNSTVYWWLKKRGLRIPEDVGVCTVHGGVGVCSGMMPQENRVAMAAVNWLDQLLRINECGLPDIPDEILLESVWMDCGTLRSAGQKASAGRRGTA